MVGTSLGITGHDIGDTFTATVVAGFGRTSVIDTFSMIWASGDMDFAGQYGQFYSLTPDPDLTTTWAFRIGAGGISAMADLFKV